MPTLFLTDASGKPIASSVRENVPTEEVAAVRQALTAVAAKRTARFGVEAGFYRIVTRDGAATIDPTMDVQVAVDRLVALIQAHPRQRGGRWMVSKAVYGDLWSPDRLGEVRPEDLPALRAVVSQMKRSLFPGASCAATVTASQVRSLWPEAGANSGER